MAAANKNALEVEGQVARRRVLLRYGPWLFFALSVWLKNVLFHSTVQIWPEGHVVVFPPLGTLASVLVLHGPLLLVAPAPRFVGSVALDGLQSAVLLCDTLHYRFAGDVLSTLTALNVGDFGAAITGGLALLRPMDAAYGIDLAIALAFLPSYFRAVRGLKERMRGPLLAAAALVLCGTGIDAHAIRNVLDGDWWLANGYVGELGETLGVVNAHVFEYGRHLYLHVGQRRQVTPHRREQVRVLLDRQRPAPANNKHYGIVRGRNVVMVMVESLQSFPIGLRVGGQEVTPHLNALRTKSLEFDRFYDQAWQGWTSDGWLSSMQGLHPLPAGAVASVFPGNHFHGLPGVLAEHGYSTLAACAYNGAMWNMGRTLASLGFARLLFDESFVHDESVGIGLGDRSFFRQVLPQITALRSPFLAFLLTESTHFPYALPEPDRTLHPGPADGHVLGDYLQAVHYLDAAIGDLIAGLKRAGLWEDTVFAVFGDHRTFNEATDNVDVARRLGVALPADAMLATWLLHHRLACIVHLPGDALAGSRLSPAGQLDLPRTMLGLLGVSDEGLVTMGRDVLREDGLVTFRDGGFAQDDRVCLVTGAREGARQCFDVATYNELPAEVFAADFNEARARLDASDTIIYGDLIPQLHR